MTEKELLALKKQVAEAKDSLAQLKGQKTALMKQLSESWKCNSLEDAKKKLTKMEGEIEVLEEEIETSIKELNEKYPE
jgi:predicted  nucleic acid-binding Zn-ribbon protein